MYILNYCKNKSFFSLKYIYPNQYFHGVIKSHKVIKFFMGKQSVEPVYTVGVTLNLTNYLIKLPSKLSTPLIGQI